MNIVFCLDDNYAALLNIAMASILKNAASKDVFNFYILHKGLSKTNQNKLDLLQKIHPFNIEFIDIDEEKYLLEFKKPAIWANKVCYYRILAPQILDKLDKILFIDVDIIVNGRLNELYELDLGDKVIGAVASPISEDEKEHIPTLNLSKNHKYFYAGLMLIDVKKWLENDIYKKAVTIDENHPQGLKWADMDILNIIFDNNYLAIHPKYSIWPGLNFAPYEYNIENYYKIYEGVNSHDEVKEAFYHPIIYQLAGGAKPWRNCATLATKKLFYKYAKLTKFKKLAKKYLSDVYEEKRLSRRFNTLKFLIKFVPCKSLRAKLRNKFLINNTLITKEQTQINKHIKKLIKLSRHLHPTQPSECIDRGFIEDYVKINKDLIHGDVLEFYGSSMYSTKYAAEKINLRTMSGNQYKSTQNADLYCDLEDKNTLPNEKFDCIIATQVLVYMVDVVSVLENLKSMLKPNGKLIVTVTGTTSPHMKEGPFIFNFTETGLKTIGSRVFGENNISNLKCYGNIKYSIYSALWIAREPDEDVNATDTQSALIIAATFTNKES